MSQKRIICLVAAAGSGTRAENSIPKQYTTIQDKAILRHTLDQLVTHPKISDIAVIYNPQHQELYDIATKGLTLLPPIKGGKERQDSIENGLKHIKQLNPDYVLIHDAARPFIDHELIDNLINALEHHKGCIPTIPVSDTVKEQSNAPSLKTIDRSTLALAQTPQAFHFSSLTHAYQQLPDTTFITDDAQALELAGMSCTTIDGYSHNFKITTPHDIKRAKHMLTNPTPDVRTGSGYDVHAFCDAKDDPNHITLCGVLIPYPRSLEAHSDADVALHALTDALLGTIGEGDIGEHFPPSDVAFKNMDSKHFVSHALSLVQSRHLQINHIDITIICEEPKIGPHKHSMRQSVAELTGVSIDRVSVKATTTEQLGFTGRKEGIAVHAIVTTK